MKHSALLTALFTTAVLTMAPAQASAQDLAGVWEITRETGRGTRTSMLSLTVEGTMLTGTMTITGGGGRGGGRVGCLDEYVGGPNGVLGVDDHAGAQAGGDSPRWRRSERVVFLLLQLRRPGDVDVQRAASGLLDHLGHR